MLNIMCLPLLLLLSFFHVPYESSLDLIRYVRMFEKNTLKILFSLNFSSLPDHTFVSFMLKNKMTCSNKLDECIQAVWRMFCEIWV